MISKDEGTPASQSRSVKRRIVKKKKVKPSSSVASSSVKEKAVEDVIDDRGSDLSSDNGDGVKKSKVHIFNEVTSGPDPLKILNDEPIYTVPRNSFKNQNDRNSSAVDPYSNMSFSQSIPMKSSCNIPSY